MTELAAAQQNIALGELWEFLPDGMMIIDRSGSILHVNGQLERLFGYKRDELSGAALERLIPERFRRQYAGLIADFTRAPNMPETDALHDLPGLRKDGSEFPIEVSLSMVAIGGQTMVAAIVRDVSQRKQVEEALRRSQEHLAMAQRMGQIGSIELDLATGKDVWSEELYRLLGLDPATTKPSVEAVLSVTHPDDRDTLQMLHASAHLGIESEPSEFRIVCPRQGVRWLLRTTKLICDASGPPRTLFVTYQDITERKVAAAAQRVADERLRMAVETSAVGIFDHDLTSGAIYWSPRLRAIFGISEDEPLTTATLVELVHPEDRLRMAAALERAREPSATPTYEIDYRILRRDGEVRWLFERSETFFDGDGEARRAVRTVGASIDITERKVAEAALRLSEEHLEQAQRIGRVGSVYINVPTGHATWSKGMYELLGLDPATVRPAFETHLQMVHPDDRALHVELRTRDMAGQKTEPAELRIVRADGTIRWLWRQSEVAVAVDGTPSDITITFHDITERKLDAEALEFSERRLREATAAAEVGIYDHDHRTDTIYWSPQQRIIYGIGADEPITLALYGTLIHPDDRDRIMAAVARAHDPNGDGRFDIEARILRRDGSIRWVVNRSQTTFEGDGMDRRPYRTIGAALDVTDRRNTEETLRRREEHLALAQRVASIGSFEVDLTTGTSHWSEGMFQLLGLDPATTLPGAEEVFRLVHPDDIDEVRRRRAQFAEGVRGTGTTEFRILQPAGGVRWIRAEGEIIERDNGRTRLAIGLLYDVTERKAADDELRRRQEHLARAQRVGHIGSAEFDVATRRQRWSDEFFAILGLDPATTEPSTDVFFERVHADDRAALVWNRDQESQGRQTRPLEMRIVRPDGEIRWVIRRVEQVAGADGKPILLTSTLQDITERKQGEDERAALERQLIQSQKLDALGQLAGGVAHDFNNLLAVILGRLEMVEEELADRPQIRDWVRSALKAARRGNSLTNMMLAFARAQPLQKKDIDPSAIVREMIDMLGHLLGETIDIKVTITPEEWRCEADPGQLQNAILNLAVNARDAMPRGGTLTIETANAHMNVSDAAKIAGAKPGDYVVISIADTGTGMPPEVLARAFEPFFTTKETGKGTGLGLSMVDGFVRQSGGYIKIESEVGRGTTVRMHLPRKTEQERAADTEAQQTPRPSGKGSILIVEDNDELRGLIADQIRMLGYKAIVAANAADGLVALRQHAEITVMLTDIELPGGVDGVEAARKAAETRPGLKFLFMTGHTEHAELPTLGNAKAPRLLRKPFPSHELARSISAAFEEG